MTICLLLAAGSSSRMGEPKMLLPFRGGTLLQHIVNEINGLPDAQLIVVTGCYHELLVNILQPQQVPLIYNDQWSEGMGSSIKSGMEYIQQRYPEASRVLLLVVDQPYISTGLLQQMQDEMERSKQKIIACTYAGTIGTPVLFDKTYFSKLLLMKGDKGAKQLVLQSVTDLQTIDFPQGAIDIDRPEDYATLLAQQQK